MVCFWGPKKLLNLSFSGPGCQGQKFIYVTLVFCMGLRRDVGLFVVYFLKYVFAKLRFHVYFQTFETRYPP